MKVLASAIAQYLGVPLRGHDMLVCGPSTLSEARADVVVFAKHYETSVAKKLNSTGGVFAIVGNSFANALIGSHILVDNPRLDFARMANQFFKTPAVPGIHAAAVVHPSATISTTATIAAGCTVGENAVIGNGTILFPNSHIFAGVKVGDHVVVDSGAVIGSTGFGHERDECGRLVSIPHFGSVIIGNEVEIGANSVIDRGTLSNTVIGDRTRIDNLVCVAHNCEIGEDCIIAGFVAICGGVKIGNRCWIAPHSSINQKLTICDDAFVTMGAIVTNGIGIREIVGGFPAFPIERYRRIVRHLQGISLQG